MAQGGAAEAAVEAVLFTHLWDRCAGIAIGRPFDCGDAWQSQRERRAFDSFARLDSSSRVSYAT